MHYAMIVKLHQVACS